MEKTSFANENEKLNYASKNPTNSTVVYFASYLVEFCARKHPEKLEELISSLEMIEVSSGKENYDGRTEIVGVCLEFINNFKKEEAMTRK